MGVNLISGRGMTHRRRRVNVHVELHLAGTFPEPGTSLEWRTAQSEVQMWTRAPNWNMQFELGPVTSRACTLRASCFHRRTRDILDQGGWVHKKKDDKLIGKVSLPLNDLNLVTEEEAINENGEVCGWFPLTGSALGAFGRAEGTGELKLGLKLINPELLPEVQHGKVDFSNSDGCDDSDHEDHCSRSSCSRSSCSSH